MKACVATRSSLGAKKTTPEIGGNGQIIIPGNSLHPVNENPVVLFNRDSPEINSWGNYQ